MSRSRWRRGCGVLYAAVLVSACGTEARTPRQPSSEGGRPPVAVSVTPAPCDRLEQSVDVVGSLSPKFFADVKSEVSGTVVAVYVAEWVPVRKGTVLARLDTSETDAAIEGLKALDAQARVAEIRARRERDRADQLLAYGLITPQAADEARSAFEATVAGSAAARAQVRTAEARLAKSTIRAPMDGVIARRSVSVGDRVENMGGGDSMFRVVDARLLELTVAVPAAQLAGVRVGHAVEFTTDALPGRTFSGHVMFINPVVDEASRSARVVVEVRNVDGSLLPGLFVRGRIVTASRSDVVQLPREALLNWDVRANTADVFVVVQDRAEKRRVRTGTVMPHRVEIVEGLSAGELVVTRGGFAIRPGERVRIAESPGA